MSNQPPSEPPGGQWSQPPVPGIPQPPAVAPVAAVPGFVFQLGDIGVTNDTVVTTSGNVALVGTSWFARDYSRTEDKIPTWAIVLAVVFAVFCLLGLLFLLVKEKTTTGYIEVQVQSGQFRHVTHIPVWTQAQVDYWMMQVGQVQAFAHRQAT